MCSLPIPPGHSRVWGKTSVWLQSHSFIENDSPFFTGWTNQVFICIYLDYSLTKVINVLRITFLQLWVTHFVFHRLTMDISKELTENLIKRLRGHIWNMESLSIMTMATLLCFYQGLKPWVSSTKIKRQAVKWLKAECTNVIRAEDESLLISTSTRSTEPPSAAQKPIPSSSIYLFICFFKKYFFYSWLLVCDTVYSVAVHVQ